MSKQFPKRDEEPSRKKGTVDARDKRQSRVNFKRYIQELEENELDEEMNDLLD